MKRKIIILVMLALFLISGCAQQKEIITLGAVLPLTGFAAARGEQAKCGIDLAVNEFNNLNKQQVQVAYEDDAAQPQPAVTATWKLIEQDNVKVIIGPLASSPAIASAEIAQKQGVVMITPVSGNPDVTKTGDYIFRTIITTTQEGEAIAELVKNMAFDKVALFYLNNDYGDGVVSGFKKSFGGTILIEEKYALADKDFRVQLLKIKEKNPQAVILVGYTELGLILKQAKELGLETQFISGAAFEGKDTLDLAGDAAEGVIYVFHSFDEKSKDEFMIELVQKIKNTCGEDKVTHYTTFSYDTTKLILQAISAVGYDPAKIKDYLSAVQNFKGAGRTIGFDENRDLLDVHTIVKTFKDREFTIYEEDINK